MKTKTIYVYDNSNSLKMTRCGQQQFSGPERTIILRFKLHIRKCKECQELLKQECLDVASQNVQKTK
jgi:hypothetical protein